MQLKTIMSIGIMAAILAAWGCNEEKNQYVAPPAPEVTVARPVVKDVTDYALYTGQTAAVESVEIRARVKGFLQKIHFQDGQIVKKGDLLFTIDPREYQAALDSQKAQLQNAKAALTFAETDLSRRQKALKANAVSEVDVLSAKSTRDQARASVAQAKAAIESAELDLSYTQITSPITGRTSRHLVDEGNLVGADGTTLLTTVLSMDPIYVYFSINEKELVGYLRVLHEEGRLSDKGEDIKPPPMEIGLTGEKGYPHQGVVNYFGNEVDPDTGTIQARGAVPNKDILMIPGLFARVRVPLGLQKDSLLVPDSAVGVDQAGQYLLVVDDQNTVKRLSVTTGSLQDSLRVITDGLKPDHRVIVEGLIRARPGIKVKPVETKQEAGDAPKADSKDPKQETGNAPKTDSKDQKKEAGDAPKTGSGDQKKGKSDSKVETPDQTKSRQGS